MKKANEMSVKELAQYIDCAVLKPELTPEEIIEAAKMGVAYGCATICVNPLYVPLLEEYVRGTDTMLCPVTDFPFGTSSTPSRVAQIEDVAKSDLVKEVDIVINYGYLKAGMEKEIVEDLKACVEATHRYNHELKVILETDALSEDEIKLGCKCCVEAGVDFVKTSTGFLTGNYEMKGACVESCALLLQEVDGKCKVKGSGRIRTREHFETLIDMGVARCGINYTSIPGILEPK